jgi:hypothetical protein
VYTEPILSRKKNLTDKILVNNIRGKVSIELFEKELMLRIRYKTFAKKWKFEFCAFKLEEIDYR